MEHPIPVTRRAVFLRSLAMSASTIGGGFVILAVMRRIYAQKLGWLTEDDMLDIASAAQSAPGAVAVNASILVGYRLCGVGGAAVSVLGTLIPPLAVMSVIAALYQSVTSAGWVGKLLLGMQAGVSAVILETAVSMTVFTLRCERADRILRVVLFAAALILSVCTGIPSALLILSAAAVGLLSCGSVKLIRRMEKEARK